MSDVNLDRRITAACRALFGDAFLLPSAAMAQNYPEKSIRFIVPMASGGGAAPFISAPRFHRQLHLLSRGIALLEVLPVYTASIS